MNKSRSRIASVKHAFAGWIHVIRTQRNAWIHLAATILVILFSIWLQLSPQELAIIALAAGLVWMAELFNTAVEALVDLTCPQFNPLAKVAKDVSAAAVLVTALSALIIGLLLLLQPLLQKLIP
jgi:diacylglycerol kinase (ATP)